MLKKMTMAAAAVLLIMVVKSAVAQDASSEDDKSRPDKQEILASMMKAGRMPAQQQTQKLDSILQDLSGSKTPRSDFLFCVGLAYAGNYQAQRCLASAYENGRGIVEDLSEAYTWYAVALENRIADENAKQMIEADKERVKTRLLAAYPHPTEDDLDDQVKAQKTLLAQYQAEMKKGKK